MRIVHISDTHGSLPNGFLPECDLVIHSGDFFPNRRRKDRPEGETHQEFLWEEAKFQATWWKQNQEDWEKWLNGTTLFFSAGNHDMAVLMGNGNIHDITEGIRWCKDSQGTNYSFYGFPYIPRLVGEWNYEVESDRLKELTLNIPPCDILVAHCPMAGMFDRDASCMEKGAGNPYLYTAIMYEKITVRKAVLSGHFHGGGGTINEAGLVISQAAERINVLDI